MGGSPAFTVTLAIRYVVLFPLLALGWLVLLAVGGVWVSAACFQFDAMDGAAWMALHQKFQAGGTIPFDFVVFAGAWPVLAALGCLILLVRLPRFTLAVETCAAVLWFRVRSAFPRLGGAHRIRKRGKARRSTRPTRSVFGHAFSAAVRRWFGRHSAAGISPPPVIPPRIEPAFGLPGALSKDAPEASVSTVEAVEAAPVQSQATDDDLAALERALALCEVWSDPPVPWMVTALCEDLDRLSTAGWGLLAEVGSLGLALLDIARAHQLLPADPDKLAIVDGLVAKRDAARHDHPGTATEDPVLDDSEPQAGEVPAQQPPVLSLCAAWLCELIENYVMLEAMRQDESKADEFAALWQGIHAETCDGLDKAMRSMSDSDWASLDRFPDRAGRIRVLTDRLREEFRLKKECGDGAAGQSPQPSEAAPIPADPPPPAMLEIAEPRPIGRPLDDCARELRAMLGDMGFILAPLPPVWTPARQATIDVLARRGTATAVLRLLSLKGGPWRIDGDSLSPWRAAEGIAVESPCRALWQSLAVLRSLGKETGRLAGAVVLAGGQFADEATLASAIANDRRRSGIEIVRLHEPSPAFTNVRAWLAALDGGL